MVKYSPSQIQTYLDCPRLWHFRYIQGIRSPSTKSQQLGKDVHAKLEEYLRGDVPSIQADGPPGEIALSGLSHLPPPRSGEVEAHFEFSVGYDDIFHGYIDYLYSDEKTVFILDHKTTSNRRYIKSVEELKSNVQAVGYAFVLRHIATGRKDPFGAKLPVLARWIYYGTRGKAWSKPVDFMFHPRELTALFTSLVLSNIDTIRRERNKKLNVWATQPNEEHCTKYGGCEFRNQCKDLQVNKSKLFTY